MNLDQDLARIIDGGPFLLGLDFDGTLANLVDHPDLAVPDPGAVEALTSLADCRSVEVVVISGRAFSDLRERLGDIPGVRVVGEHGNDLGEEADADTTIARAEALIRRLAREAGGATVERKPHSVTFHYRHLEDDEAESFLTPIREWADRHDGIRLLEGKKVIELTTATKGKGDSITELAEGRPIVYIGDDVTDESVFEVLGPPDLGIKVGEGPTAASHRVEDVAGVVRILEKIALVS